MHKFHSLPPNSAVGGVALALAASIAFVDGPARASSSEIKSNDSKAHSATRSVQRADCRLTAGG